MRIKATITIVLATVSCAAAAQGSMETSERQGQAALQVPKKNAPDDRPQPPVLVDATGKIAGLYSPATTTVVLKLGEALILANVTNQLDVNAPFTSLGEQSGSTLRWAIVGQTWFLSSDCSGPPIPLASGGLRPVAYTQDRATGALTAFIGGAGISSARPANSVRQAALGGGPFSGQCVTQTPAGGTIQGFDIVQTMNISQRFPPPLTVQ